MARGTLLILVALVFSCGSETSSDPADAAEADAASDSGVVGRDAAASEDGGSTADDAGNDSGASDAGGSQDAEMMSDAEDPGGPYSFLLFSRTEGFRHGSIPDAIDAIRTRAEAAGHTVTATEDPSRFADEALAPYDAVVFVMTTGDILNGEQQAAFERFIGAGGGWAGIHSASDTEYDWAWYGGLVGAYFDNHPSIQEADLEIEVADHLSTAHLPATWTRRDEWYNFRENPRGEVTVLLTIDEATFNGGQMGDDHPMAWCHDYDGGRSWYTAGGHTNASYEDDDFMEHVMGGLYYAAGEGSCP